MPEKTMIFLEDSPAGEPGIRAQSGPRRLPLTAGPAAVSGVMQYLRSALFLLIPALAVAACDTGITGSGLDNNAPDTQLSVRDTSLVDNIGDEDRLASSVFVSWSGTDPDGYVQHYELRAYDESERPGAEDGWVRTARVDTLILLPIPRGERFGNAVVEVRAVDNEGIKDPTPARTIFPIRNTPPTLRLLQSDLPSDTTYPVVSFGLAAADQEGEQNLARIEVALNDSTNFVALPPDIDFFTLVGDIDSGNPAQTETTARIYTGRGFLPTDAVLPDFRLDAENTIYVRAVDQTDTTSANGIHTWFVKKPKSEILFVNDYRASASRAASNQRYHLDVLRQYVGQNTPIEILDASSPYFTGSTISYVRSDQLPANADPTLRQTLRLFKYIYWVASNATGQVTGYNLPYVASVMDEFFDNGGRLMVLSPTVAPNDPQDNVSNPALQLLPVGEIVKPDSVQTLQIRFGGDIVPAEPVPGTGETLPPLEARSTLSTLPILAPGASIVPLYRAQFTYINDNTGSAGAAWTGPSVVAAMTSDQRVGYFGIDIVSAISGTPTVQSPGNTNPNAPMDAIHLMLQGLGFPR